MATESSGLEFIDNQPIVFGMSEDSCLAILDQGYCQQRKRTDPVKVQITRLACGVNAVCTNTSPEYGDNLIANGTFGTGDLTGWTTTGWTYSAGKALAPASPAGTNELTQTFALIPGIRQRITAVVAGLDPGDTIQIWFGSNSGYYLISTNGVVDMNVISLNGDNANITFIVPGTNTGQASIDDITVTIPSYCYNGPGWLYTPDTNKYLHTPGYTSSLDAYVDFVQVGKQFKITILVTGSTAGTNQIVVGANGSDLLSGNGTFSRYIDSGTSTGFSIIPSSDFDGSVEITEIYALTEPSDLFLVDMDGNEIADLSGFYTLADNKINISFTLDELVLDGDDVDAVVPNGCYRIRVSGLCNPIEVDLTVDGDFDDIASNWLKSQNPFQYDTTTPGQVEYIFEPTLDGVELVSNGDFAGGSTGWSGTNWVIVAGVGATHTPGSTASLVQTITVSAPALSPAQLFTWWSVRVTGRTAGGFSVKISDQTSGIYFVNDTVTHFLIPTIGGGPVSLEIIPTSGFDGTVELVHVNETNRYWSALVEMHQAPNPDIIAGKYQGTTEITSVTGTTANTIGTIISIRYPTGGEYFHREGVGTHSHQFDYTPGSMVIQTGGWFITPNNIYYPGRIICTRVAVARLEPLEGTQYSNCIQFADSWPCTKWVEASGDCFAHGFDFRGGFTLGMRVPMLRFGPSYPNKKSTYVYSNGENQITSSERDKIWQVKTDKMDEIAHDALSVMLLCQTFLVDLDEFFFKSSDYKVAWNKSGRFSVASASFELSAKTSVTFATNCGDCSGVAVFTGCSEICATAIALKSDFAGSPGVYMVDGANQLEYNNGSIWTGPATACDGYIGCYPGDFSGPYRFNSVLGDWEPIIALDDFFVSLGVGFVDGIILPGAAGRVQSSADGGLTWSNITAWQSAAQVLSGVTFVAPVGSFRMRLAIKYATCTYYSQENLTYE